MFWYLYVYEGIYIYIHIFAIISDVFLSLILKVSVHRATIGSKIWAYNGLQNSNKVIMT